MAITDSAGPAPLKCPFCRSPQIATTSKAVNDNAYWRCQACGQIWNPSRLKPAPNWR
jgi:transposase-like protein